MRLLPEPFPAFRTGIGSRFYVDAAVLEQRRLLLELLLADGTAHVERHAGRSPVLDDVGKAFARLALLLQILQGAEIRRRTEHRMVHALGVLEVRRILQVARYAAWGEATRTVVLLGTSVAVAVCRSDFFLTLVGWERNVLRPQCRVDAVFEHQVRTHI